jgi:hypothetical protein
MQVFFKKKIFEYKINITQLCKLLVMKMLEKHFFGKKFKLITVKVFLELKRDDI